MLADPIDKFVFEYGRLCCEDFNEVLLMSANGYGVGATKLLRTLYEHAVTLDYLNEHPDELDDFWDYAFVAQHKYHRAICDAFGEQAFESSRVREEDVERAFESVKERFMVTNCKKCQSKKLNHTWNKLDFVSMAKQSGGLGALIIPGYYFPLTHAHSTAASLTSRLTLHDGIVSFVPTAQREEAEVAVRTAHSVILRVLEIQDTRFAVPGLREKLQTCFQDYLDIWKDRKPNSDPNQNSGRENGPA